MYSPEQLRSLVSYANLRGVRVMPEYDLPGHGDWAVAEPDIMVMDGPPGCNITLDPTKDGT